MSLGTEVGLGPRHIVLDGDPARHTETRKGAQQPASTFAVCGRCVRINRGPGPCLLWPNDWMDQDATWYGGRSRRKRHCVSWKLSSPFSGRTPILGSWMDVFYTGNSQNITRAQQLLRWGPFGHNRHGPKSGRGCCAHFCGELRPHLTQCRLGRGLPRYLRTKWHLDPSNRLATIHQRYRQTRQTGQRFRGIRRTVTCNGRPKSCILSKLLYQFQPNFAQW